MKLNEIFQTYLAESVNAVVMQQHIYDYVLKKLKEKNPTIHFSYAVELAKTTEVFHTAKFDDCKEAFDKAETIEEVEDALQAAIEGVSEMIIDFFEDSDNHPNGWVSQKIVGIDHDTPSREEIDKLIKKIDPQLEKHLENF